MITSNILRRTFYIRYEENTGTAFTIEVDGLQYIITAKHLLDNADSHDYIYVFHDSMWKKHLLKNKWLSPTADVALLSPVSELSPRFPVGLGNNTSYYLSEQIYFLGFPYGLKAEMGEANNDFPLPFVKTGIISSIEIIQKGSSVIFCDGINNPGFSGGPIVTVSKDQTIKIIGIISGYKHNEDHILINGKDSGLRYKANTGLIVGHGINEIIEEAHKRKDGAKLTS